MSKYSDVERLMRLYRDSGYKLDQLKRERKYSEEAKQEINGLQAQRYGVEIKVHGGMLKDPVYITYEQEVQRYDNATLRLTARIREIERHRAYIDSLLHALEAKEEALMRWKYVDGLSERYLLSRLKKEYNYPICRAQLYKMIDDIYDKILKAAENVDKSRQE